MRRDLFNFAIVVEFCPHELWLWDSTRHLEIRPEEGKRRTSSIRSARNGSTRKSIAVAHCHFPGGWGLAKIGFVYQQRKTNSDLFNVEQKSLLECHPIRMWLVFEEINFAGVPEFCRSRFLVTISVADWRHLATLFARSNPRRMVCDRSTRDARSTNGGSLDPSRETGWAGRRHPQGEAGDDMQSVAWQRAVDVDDEVSTASRAR